MRGWGTALTGAEAAAIITLSAMPPHTPARFSVSVPAPGTESRRGGEVRLRDGASSFLSVVIVIVVVVAAVAATARQPLGRAPRGRWPPPARPTCAGAPRSRAGQPRRGGHGLPAAPTCAPALPAFVPAASLRPRPPPAVSRRPAEPPGPPAPYRAAPPSSRSAPGPALPATVCAHREPSRDRPPTALPRHSGRARRAPTPSASRLRRKRRVARGDGGSGALRGRVLPEPGPASHGARAGLPACPSADRGAPGRVPAPHTPLSAAGMAPGEEGSPQLRRRPTAIHSCYNQQEAFSCHAKSRAGDLAPGAGGIRSWGGMGWWSSAPQRWTLRARPVPLAARHLELLGHRQRHGHGDLNIPVSFLDKIGPIPSWQLCNLGPTCRPFFL